jgi:hypothetical protein
MQKECSLPNRGMPFICRCMPGGYSGQSQTKMTITAKSIKSQKVALMLTLKKVSNPTQQQ